MIVINFEVLLSRIAGDVCLISYGPVVIIIRGILRFKGFFFFTFSFRMIVLYFPIVYLFFKMLESKIADGESFKSSFFEPCVPLIWILIGAFIKKCIFYAI